MLVADVNLLLYATNADSPRHAAAKRWWEKVLSGDETIALPWLVILAFLRISTNPKIFPKPLEPIVALRIVDEWLALPSVQILEPTERHWGILKDLLASSGTAGNLTSDAHLAAFAIEHGAVLCSADTDFRRFAKLRWQNPIAP